MFLSDSHLPQVLPSAAYWAGDWFDRERAAVFEPAWHFVGLTGDLPREGSFLTADVCGRPVIVWHTSAGLRAFLNVCPHRASMLTREPTGCVERLTCGYHGWEFDESGDTRRIPDARSFRPMKKGQLGLTPLRVDTAGQAIFLNLHDAGPPLAESLGPGAELIADFTGGRFRHVGTFDRTEDFNWKLIVENAIESYHVEFVHTKTFAKSPKAELCEHTVGDWGSNFSTVEEGAVAKWRGVAEHWIHRWFGHDYLELYEHHLFYPNVMAARSKFYRFLFVVDPVGPTRARVRFLSFGDPGPTRNPLAAALFGHLSRSVVKYSALVLEEDFGVLPNLQKGLESPDRPTPGYISVREERVHHFQRYIDDAMHPGAVRRAVA